MCTLTMSSMDFTRSTGFACDSSSMNTTPLVPGEVVPDLLAASALSVGRASDSKCMPAVIAEGVAGMPPPTPGDPLLVTRLDREPASARALTILRLALVFGVVSTSSLRSPGFRVRGRADPGRSDADLMASTGRKMLMIPPPSLL
jgi:hypothetical protein